jgi:uncharacterized protein
VRDVRHGGVWLEEKSFMLPQTAAHRNSEVRNIDSNAMPRCGMLGRMFGFDLAWVSSAASALPPWVWVVAPCAALLAYTVFGMTGFGASIILLPMLAQLMPVKQIVPMAVLVDVIAAAIVNRRGHRDANWAEVKRIVPGQLIGMAIGVYILANASSRAMMLALGIFVLVYALWNIRKPELKHDWPAWAAWPVGIAGGVFSAMFGTGGPIYVIYLTRRCPTLAELRATVAALILISTGLRLTLFAVGGFYAGGTSIVLALWCLPFMLVAVFFGMRLHKRVKAESVLRMIYGLLIITGSGLILRAMGHSVL